MRAVLAILVVLISAPAVAGELQVRVRVTDRGFDIINESPSKLENCSVIVNSKYKKRWFDIAVNGSRDLWFSELQTDNDVRFDPKLDRFERFHLICRGGDILMAPK